VSLLYVTFIAIAIGLRLVFSNSRDTLVHYAVSCNRVTNLRGTFRYAVRRSFRSLSDNLAAFHLQEIL
jgi:hypothetical protein